MMILTIAQREIRSLFYSPLAWAILGITQLILAYLFLAQLQEYIHLQPQLKMMATGNSSRNAASISTSAAAGSNEKYWAMVLQFPVQNPV